MERKEIIEQVNAMLAEEFEKNVEDFTPDAVLWDTLELDSLSLVDLVALVQQTYKVNIPVSDLKSIKTFDNLYTYIETHLPQA